MSVGIVLALTRRRRSAGVLAFGGAAGLAMLAGCGQAATDASGAGGSGGAAGHVVAARFVLCADPVTVSRVQIAAIPQIGQLAQPVRGTRKIFKITITDRPKARTLARAICGLPRMPRGAFHCPADFGGGYQLTFTAAGRRLPVVNVGASGCETVTGGGPVRWIARTPGFWKVLGKVTGVQAIAHRP